MHSGPCPFHNTWGSPVLYSFWDRAGGGRVEREWPTPTYVCVTHSFLLWLLPSLSAKGCQSSPDPESWRWPGLARHTVTVARSGPDLSSRSGPDLAHMAVVNNRVKQLVVPRHCPTITLAAVLLCPVLLLQQGNPQSVQQSVKTPTHTTHTPAHLCYATARHARSSNACCMLGR
jgi:hypothetical protein